MANSRGRADACPHDGQLDAAVSAPERPGTGYEYLASPASPPAPVTWPDGFTAAACLTFDLDAEAAVLTADISSVYRMSPMSHQAYGPLVGVPRILDLLARHHLRATFFVPGYSAILTNVFLAHFSLLGAGIWTAELLVGITLLFGLFTRFGALLAALLSVQLYIGLAYAPGEWYWTYGMLVLLALALVAVPAGRRMGIDQLLAPRLQHAARTSRLARFMSRFV